MDRTGIIVVSICIALLALWFVAEQKYYSHAVESPTGTNIVVAAGNQTSTSNAAPSSPSAPATPATVTTTSTTPAFPLATNVPEKMIVVTNAHARYTFTSRGGGLKSVDLLDYPETVSLEWKQEMASNTVATLNTRASVPVMAILGETNLIGNGNFTLTRTGNRVQAEKTLHNGLHIVKEFDIGSNYLMNVTVWLENTATNALPLPTQEWVVGTATPMGPDDRTFTVYGGTMWFNGSRDKSETLSYFSTNTTFLWVFPRTPKTEYLAGNSNVVWSAVYNQYFALIAMPKEPATQTVSRPVYLAPIPNSTPEHSAAPNEGIQTALIYPAQTLGTNQTIVRKITLYAGPKEYQTLAHLGEEYHDHIANVMQFGFFGFFAKALLVTMNWVHDVTRFNYGWAIVLITVALRGIFWPLTAKSTRSMKRMQQLAPELKVLQEKYKEEPQKLMQKQWELYRKNKVSPMSGCLPMVIQIPVFFGFFTMLRSAIELRGAHFLWVADLSKPDTLFLIPGINFPFNLLPLLMVGAMIWQAHIQPPSPGMDQSAQKMMRFFPVLMLLFLYNYSSGMALYMTVSTVMGIIQTRFIRMNQAPATTPSPALTPPKKRKR